MDFENSPNFKKAKETIKKKTKEALIAGATIAGMATPAQSQEITSPNSVNQDTIKIENLREDILSKMDSSETREITAEDLANAQEQQENFNTRLDFSDHENMQIPDEHFWQTDVIQMFVAGPQFAAISIVPDSSGETYTVAIPRMDESYLVLENVSKEAIDGYLQDIEIRSKNMYGGKESDFYRSEKLLERMLPDKLDPKLKEKLNEKWGINDENKLLEINSLVFKEHFELELPEAPKD